MCDGARATVLTLLSFLFCNHVTLLTHTEPTKLLRISVCFPVLQPQALSTPWSLLPLDFISF